MEWKRMVFGLFTPAWNSSCRISLASLVQRLIFILPSGKPSRIIFIVPSDRLVCTVKPGDSVLFCFIPVKGVMVRIIESLRVSHTPRGKAVRERMTEPAPISVVSGV